MKRTNLAVVQTGDFAKIAAASLFASIVGEVDDEGSCSVAVSGGTTVGPILRELARNPLMPWDKVRWFFADERCVAPTDPESNYRVVKEALFDRAPISPTLVFRMDGERPNRSGAAADYERKLPHPISIALLGIGEDGHFASVFPNSELLAERTRRVAAVRGPKPPPWRITLTPLGLEGAHILVVATGAAKANAVRRALEGDEPVEQVPARLWRDHYWIVDEGAASELGRKA